MMQKALHTKIGKQYEDARNLGVKQGPLCVGYATMPSILVRNCLFEQRKEEERPDPEYQDATVAGIVDGIKGYISGLK
jgi:N-acetylmuramoyl-L-alanine amidase